ncbi:neurofilament medium polypeptide, putative [Entamoeba dispar SAW760]|uniref:Neurofilament medium polypeptide, putative n=1 Tax=Entamoeba dispar (strain ATCC PRA-260 / SAW760) TaxID=370354 RepID=B0EN91_ENTDS|nr:neurofilament medium polypeptide, putative [Entamoeba dispar SAW760]EDR24005.1 neurofilament medium polypeptide, putative [Entamoeba dispar SAW760]|eukprot:EDR24005.1 neurofilament medium polypeptide, putative [Entamoeba dispar SAW760]
MSSEEEMELEQESDDVEIDRDNWGKNTDVYYQKKRDKELKNDEFIEGDAEEAQRIQKELLSNLKVSDFGGDEEFEQLMKKTKEAPPEETEEFQLKKFNEMIDSTNVQIEGNDEERIKIIKEMFPELLQRILLASKISFEKSKEGGVLGKFTSLREKVESGLILNVLIEILCKGDGREEHPIVETCKTYQQLFENIEETTKKIGKQTIKSFYDGTYKEEYKESEEQINEEGEEDTEIKGNSSLNEMSEEEDNKEQKMEESEEEEEGININDMDMEDALGDFVDEEEMKEIKQRQELQKVNQPNIDETDKANWIDNDDFDSDEVQLEEKLLAELASKKQSQRKASGEEDVIVKKTTTLIKPSKKQSKINQEDEEIKTTSSLHKEIENKRKLRLTKAQKEEKDIDNYHRPVDKVVEHGRGLTRGRKPQNSRTKMRAKYEKRTKKIKQTNTESHSFNYKGEKKIEDGKKLSRKLDY